MAKSLSKFVDPPGATPLSDDEKEGLIPDHITTRQELNAWEGANILKAEPWAFRRKHADLLTDHFVRRMHAKMFDVTWEWAGLYRKSDKSIGIHWRNIAVSVRDLMGDVVAWQASSAYSTEEMAIRLHHRLVFVHPFPNGNGRHARMFADMFLRQAGQSRFTWGRTNLDVEGQARSAYIGALREADLGNVAPLLTFART